MGGKTRLAPWLLDIMLKHRKPEQWYIEPFCGGCNVIDKVEGKRIAIDSNEYLIAMWKALQRGWIPPKHISREQYVEVMNNKERYKPQVVAFTGFCSFGGKWFAGYPKGKEGRDYTGSMRTVVLTQIERMQDVKFHCLNALQITSFPKESLIYCDPPYAGTTNGYKHRFDSSKFWQWADKLVSQGHKVFISEKEAPPDWEKVFERATNNDLNSRTLVERLFTK